MRRNSSDPVFDWLAYYAQYDPGRLAAVDLATQRRLTYGQFNDRATRPAATSSSWPRTVCRLSADAVD